jgi:hypothetical protein
MDVDGPFFGTYDGALQLKPGANTFLRWAVEHFDCRWLTCWPHEEILKWLKSTYCSYTDVLAIPYIRWMRGPGGGDKVNSVDLTADFFWFEDGIGREAERVLQEAGKLDRYIFTDFYDREAIYKLKAELERRLAERHV